MTRVGERRTCVAARSAPRSERAPARSSLRGRATSLSEVTDTCAAGSEAASTTTPARLQGAIEHYLGRSIPRAAVEMSALIVVNAKGDIASQLGSAAAAVAQVRAGPVETPLGHTKGRMRWLHHWCRSDLACGDCVHILASSKTSPQAIRAITSRTLKACALPSPSSPDATRPPPPLPSSEERPDDRPVHAARRALQASAPQRPPAVRAGRPARRQLHVPAAPAGAVGRRRHHGDVRPGARVRAEARGRAAHGYACVMSGDETRVPGRRAARGRVGRALAAPVVAAPCRCGCPARGGASTLR